jgi:hypothetical protein
MAETAGTASLARSSPGENVLGEVDFMGLILSELLLQGGGGGGGQEDLKLGTRAANSLCLASKSVRTAVLASVQRVRMDGPQPAVLQHMASLVSLHVSPGCSRLRFVHADTLQQLTCLRADGIMGPRTLSAIVQLTRLLELRLEIVARDSGPSSVPCSASRASAASAAWASVTPRWSSCQTPSASWQPSAACVWTIAAGCGGCQTPSASWQPSAAFLRMIASVCGSCLTPSVS